MKPELDRVKNDLETMEKAMGLAPAFGRDWIRCVRRDNWLNLWWFLPALILIGSAFVPLDNTRRFWGLVPNQWVGLSVAAVMLVMLWAWQRTVMRGDRPASVLRDYKRINAQSGWWLLTFLAQFGVFLFWTSQHHLSGAAVMSGLWLLTAFSMLTLAVSAKLWLFLGWVVPLVVFALCQPLMHAQSRWDGVWLGTLFIAGALLSSVIQAWELRGMERRHVAD